jgi:hypothetical protein
MVRLLVAAVALCAASAQQQTPLDTIRSALADPKLSHSSARSWTTDDGDFSLKHSFVLHPDVEMSGEDSVSRRQLNSGRPLEKMSHAVKSGSVELIYKPKATHEQRRLNPRQDGGRSLETTTYCNDKCEGFKNPINNNVILPKEGDVLVTVNGTTYDVGDYEICRECVEVRTPKHTHTRARAHPHTHAHI